MKTAKELIEERVCNYLIETDSESAIKLGIERLEGIVDFVKELSLKEMSSTIKKIKSDPKRFKPQLDNLINSFNKMKGSASTAIRKTSELKKLL